MTKKPVKIKEVKFKKIKEEDIGALYFFPVEVSHVTGYFGNNIFVGQQVRVKKIKGRYFLA